MMKPLDWKLLLAKVDENIYGHSTKGSRGGGLGGGGGSQGLPLKPGRLTLPHSPSQVALAKQTLGLHFGHRRAVFLHPGSMIPGIIPPPHSVHIRSSSCQESGMQDGSQKAFQNADTTTSPHHPGSEPLFPSKITPVHSQKQTRRELLQGQLLNANPPLQLHTHLYMWHHSQTRSGFPEGFTGVQREGLTI